MLQLEARKIASKQNILSTEFKASYGWVRRFMKRHDLAIRQQTSIAQHLPETYQEKLLEFQKLVIMLRKKNDYNLAAIGNADETPVFFNMPGDTKVNELGASTVQVRTAGVEKQKCTEMLAITADGHKLTPYAIFKRKTLPKEKLHQVLLFECSNTAG